MGAKKDGSSVHFFHRTSKAYATGQRKRRKICGPSSSSTEHVRWHKTGKTKAVIENGVQKGCKKIMVLYKSSKKGVKPDKSNWVMHQYHLGTNEDEKDGEFVVCKIFYQQQLKQSEKSEVDPAISEKGEVSPAISEKSEVDPAIGESVAVASRACPSTPKTYTPNQPRLGKRPLLDDIEEENLKYLPNQGRGLLLPALAAEPLQAVPPDTELLPLALEYHLPAVNLEDDKADPVCWADEAQAMQNSYVDNFLFCSEIPNDDTGPKYDPVFIDFDQDENGVMNGDNDVNFGISDLDNLELGTPPDLTLGDLRFSQDSFTGWIDQLLGGGGE